MVAGRGKVTYDYDAENEDELTVKVGDILEIVEVEPDGQEGWVMVGVVVVCGCVGWDEWVGGWVRLRCAWK